MRHIPINKVLFSPPPFGARIHGRKTVLGGDEVMPDPHNLVLKRVGSHFAFVEKERPKTRPPNCGLCNEDLDCLGCGVKLGTVCRGHCYAVEGEKALQPEEAQK